MTSPEPRGVLFDFGGVLTTSIAGTMRNFEETEDLPKGTLFEVFAAAYTDADDDHPISRLERGESTVEEFEHALLGQLRERGHEVAPGNLLGRLFATYEPLPEMWEVVAACREAGARTGLLSNSWGVEGYPEDLIDQHFDERVISGEVGLRKPDPEIYRLAAQRLGVSPDRCAFVDDAQPNVEAAQALGMTAIQHRDVATTRDALAAFLGAEL